MNLFFGIREKEFCDIKKMKKIETLWDLVNQGVISGDLLRIAIVPAADGGRWAGTHYCVFYDITPTGFRGVFPVLGTACILRAVYTPQKPTAKKFNIEVEGKFPFKEGGSAYELWAGRCDALLENFVSDPSK